MRYLFKQWKFLLWGAICTIFSAHRGHALPPDYSKTPVVFVHGSGMSASTWKNMIAAFIQLGYPPEYLHAVELRPNEGSNERAASVFLEPAVETLLQQATDVARKSGFSGKLPTKVDLVSHSMGAASTRWYAAKLHPERVRIWISVAGANHGTNSLCGYVDSGAGNREMCPAFAKTTQESAFQVALNGTPDAPRDETPFGVGTDRNGVQRIPPDDMRRILYYSIRIEPDQWIKPESSAIIDGAGGMPVALPADLPVKETSPGNYLFTKNVGHDPLPEDADLIRCVALLLAVRDQ